MFARSFHHDVDAALWPVMTHPSRGLRKINRKPQTPTIPHATSSKLQMCRRAGAMLTREDYRQLAERCALLAGECGAPGVAEATQGTGIGLPDDGCKPEATTNAGAFQIIS